MKDIIVFSHLRWDFVFQRPQQIMSRLAKKYRITFVEEAVYTEQEDGYTVTEAGTNLRVMRPHLQSHIRTDLNVRNRIVLDRIIADHHITAFAAWYYSPMFYAYSDHLFPLLVVYDCMDELSAFLFAPPELQQNETALMEDADLVFTGGISLYEARKDLRPEVYCMPSSIDKKHFAQAREILPDPPDQSGVPFPRFGFFGVIDERFDIDLIRIVADQKPEWQFVILGPVVKIDENTLPRRPNIHYLGKKEYHELPAYLSNWQVAFLPFAINDATRFISPTKTPEYLAAGKPVISTPVRDVVRTYGPNTLVEITADAAAFIQAGEKLLQPDSSGWLSKVDRFLEDKSWDSLVADIDRHLQNALVALNENV